MLCQSQLYQGTYKEALKTALRLVLYEKELGSKQVYQLIALTSFLNKNYKFCSKALSTLEQLPSLTRTQRQSFKDLAVNIFTRYEPKNRNENMIICPSKNCGSFVIFVEVILVLVLLVGKVYLIKDILNAKDVNIDL